MTIKTATTAADILKCRDAILELRPHLTDIDLVAIVQEMFSEGFKLIYAEAEDGRAGAICGYVYQHKLFNGKHIYIDDLATLPEYRGKGYGKALLDYVDAEAREQGFGVVTLDSGHQRHAAHRLYLNHGYSMIAHHFMKKL